MRIHLGKKDHKCPHCDYSSVRKDNLKSHMKTHDKNNDQSNTRKRTTPTSDLSTLLCNKRFKSSDFYNVHTNKNEFRNNLTIHNSDGINYAPNGLEQQIHTTLHGNIFPQQYFFSCNQLANVIKRRQCEEIFDNRSEKIIDKTKKQSSCKLGKSEENKTVYMQQQLSKANKKTKINL